MWNVFKLGDICELITKGTTPTSVGFEFQKEGINVNLVEILDHSILNCATYERGVENETLSCGTGVTAVALAANAAKKLNSPISVKTKGGQLSVRFTNESGSYKEVFLKGPVKMVFKGEITL